MYSTVGQPAINAQVDTSLVASLNGIAEKKAIKTAKNKDGHRYLTSLEKYAPLVVIDEKEMKLIKAELVVRGLMQGDAMQLVNDVLAFIQRRPNDKLRPYTGRIGSSATRIPLSSWLSHRRSSSGDSWWSCSSHVGCP